MEGLKNLPTGVQLNALSASVFEVLEQHTAFPWPVLAAQCKRYGRDPENLSPADLDELIVHLANGVARFTSPEKGETVQRDLAAVLRQHR